MSRSLRGHLLRKQRKPRPQCFGILKNNSVHARAVNFPRQSNSREKLSPKLPAELVGKAVKTCRDPVPLPVAGPCSLASCGSATVYTGEHQVSVSGREMGHRGTDACRAPLPAPNTATPPCVTRNKPIQCLLSTLDFYFQCLCLQSYFLLLTILPLLTWLILPMQAEPSRTGICGLGTSFTSVHRVTFN